MAISKERKQIILNHTAIKLYQYSSSSFEFRWMWVIRWIKFYWHSVSMWDRLGRLNLFVNFSLRGYPPLIRKDSVTYIHCFTVYAKEGLPFARDLSLKQFQDSNLRFQLGQLHLVCYFFFLRRLPFRLFAQFLMLFHLTLTRFSRSHHLLMYLSLEALTFITFSDRPGELFDNF